MIQYFGIGTLNWILILLVVPRPAVGAAAPIFWTGSGTNDPSSCSFDYCQACPVAKFRSNCGGSSSGSCVDCSTATALPENARWTQAGFSAPCPWECIAPFVLTDGACNVLYAVSLTINVGGVTPAQAQNNIATLVAPIASLSNCGTCNYARFPEMIQCDRCYITVVLKDISTRRRLLGAVTQIGLEVVTSGGQAQAQAAATQLTALNINSQLASSGYSVAVATSPTVTVQTVASAATTMQTTMRTTPSPASGSTPSPSDSSNNTGAAVGAVVGALLGVGVIGVVVYCLVSRKQASNRGGVVVLVPVVPPRPPVPSPPYEGGPATPVATAASVNAQLGFRPTPIPPAYIQFQQPLSGIQFQQRQRFHSLPLKLRY